MALQLVPHHIHHMVVYCHIELHHLNNHCIHSFTQTQTQTQTQTGKGTCQWIQRATTNVIVIPLYPCAAAWPGGIGTATLDGYGFAVLVYTGPTATGA
jgi:hypothetical protein